MKVIQWMCVTLNSKVNRQGHGNIFNIFDILDLENVRIDTKINFVSCLQPEIWKVMQKGVWPWFSRSCNKDRIFSLSPLDSLTPKTYPWEIFLKNSDGKTKIQGGGTHPPLGRPKVDFYLGHLRVNIWSEQNLNILCREDIQICYLVICRSYVWKCREVQCSFCRGGGGIMNMPTHRNLLYKKLYGEHQQLCWRLRMCSQRERERRNERERERERER